MPGVAFSRWRCGPRGGVSRKSAVGKWYNVPITHVPVSVLKHLRNCSKSNRTIIRGKLCIELWNPPIRRRYIVLPIPSPEQAKQSMEDVRNQMYFLSTGTSNEEGFGGVLFPAAGISEISGWVQKLPSNELFEWRVKFCELIDSMRGDGLCQTRFNNFLSGFGQWFHVQQSAAFGGEFWQRPDVQYLRDLALNFNWDQVTKEFVQSDSIVQRYDFPKKCIVFHKSNQQAAKEINALLHMHQAYYGYGPFDFMSGQKLVYFT